MLKYPLLFAIINICLPRKDENIIMDYESLLNPQQYEAVIHNKGPLLILAGAGSGKTRVLTYRIAYLIEEYGVNPWNILALTFTNKAAAEMRSRVDDIVGYGAESIWVSTFHSTCVRILRKYIEHLGFESSFTIYDSSDQKTLMKDVCKTLNIDTTKVKESFLLNEISNAKDLLISPIQYATKAQGDYPKEIVAKVYTEYQRALKKNNALDFDDLIFKTVELFREFPESLEYYQRRFKYIMVDEYQDTNHAQFVLISMLASTVNEYDEIEHNLCVVGDDDQSIYRFRGADITNILDFEKQFPNTKVIKLEQNYRSTKSIIGCANEVIKKNTGRKDKALWTDNEQGDLVSFTMYPNAKTEAKSVADAIISGNREHNTSYNDFAILYRTNAQSRYFEEEFVKRNIPYKLIGGQNFYGRKEIKDLLAYLRVLNNPEDDISLKRIINVPKRGIGQTTINRITQYAQDNDISFYTALTHAKSIEGVSRGVDKIDGFVTLIELTRQKSDSNAYKISELMDELLEDTGYLDELKLENTVEANTRLEYIDEFLNKIIAFEDENEEETASLAQFLEEVSLVADIDNYDDNEETVVLMTLHGSKGLEFPNVFLAGMEDGIFPSYRSLNSDTPDEDVAEERRLCYVGITRARQRLALTAAKERMINGQTIFSKPSRFINEIPRFMLKMNTEDKKGGNPYTMKSTSFVPGTNTQLKGISKNNTQEIKSTSPFGGNVFLGKSMNAFDKSIASAINYSVGDNVSHIKFGKGTVEQMVLEGNDYTVTVDFERFGQKKMKASFAKLKLL